MRNLQIRNQQVSDLFSELTRHAAFLSLASKASAPPKTPSALRLSGLTLTAKALYAVLLHHATGRPQLIVVDGNKQAEALFPLLQTFADLVNPAHGLEIAPLILPALDVLPGQNMSPHAEILATARRRAFAPGERLQGHHARAGCGRAFTHRGSLLLPAADANAPRS